MAAAATAAAMRNKMNNAAFEEAQKEGERRAAQVRHDDSQFQAGTQPIWTPYLRAVSMLRRASAGLQVSCTAA